MTGWTLEYNGEEKPFAKSSLVDGELTAGWGLTAPTMQFTNQQIDVCQFEQPGQELDSTPIFEEGGTGIIRLDGVRKFYGRFRAPRRRASAQSAGFAWRLEGPWYWLTQIVFRQLFKVYGYTVNGAVTGDPEDPDGELLTTYSGRIFLGQNNDGSAAGSSSQIQAVIAWAISQGATMQLDTANIPDVNFPVFEVKNAYCSECVIKLLQLAPDAVAWFDYATEPYPTLKIKQRGDLTPVTIPVDGGTPPGPLVESVEIDPRDDLLTTAVVIEYEQTNVVNGAQLRNVTYDIWPEGSTGIAPGTLVATVNLEGANVSYAQATIECDPILSNSTDPGQRFSWWIIKRPEWRRTSPDPGNPEATYISNMVITPKPRVFGTVNELTSGQYAPWMGGRMVDETIQAYATYNINRTVDGQETTIERRINEYIAVKIKSTDLESGTYYSSPDPSSSYAEPIPTGMAQFLSEATSVLQYDGGISLIEQECSGLVGLGNVVNLGDGAAVEFQTMNALVQDVTWNVGTGQTTIRVGPPKHLGPDDLMELVRPLRNRQRYTPLASRTTGRGGVSGMNELGSDTAKESNTSGTSVTMLSTWYDPLVVGGAVVKIDIAGLQYLIESNHLTVAQVGTIQPTLITASRYINGACQNGRMIVMASNFIPS